MRNIRGLVMSSALAALIGIWAWISIPIGPVPITLQALFVYLAGLLLPVRYASFSVFLYIFLGILGLPVFAGGGAGLGVVMGPTGGYLFGFLFAATFISLLTAKLRAGTHEHGQWLTYVSPFLSCLAGSTVIFALGALWGKFSTGLSWNQIFIGWVFPFIPGDIAKMVVATLISSEIWKRGLLKSRYE